MQMGPTKYGYSTQILAIFYVLINPDKFYPTFVCFSIFQPSNFFVLSNLVRFSLNFDTSFCPSLPSISTNSDASQPTWLRTDGHVASRPCLHPQVKRYQNHLLAVGTVRVGRGRRDIFLLATEYRFL